MTTNYERIKNMTDEEIKEYINKICLNIGYSLQDYLRVQIPIQRHIQIGDIPNIINKAIKRTDEEKKKGNL